MAPSTSKTKRPAKISKRKTIIGVATLKRAELFKSLEKSGVNFDEDALKPELQAVWALKELGIVSRGDTPDENLLDYATSWCSMSVKELASELEERVLDESSNKWTRVETLIRDE